MYKLTKDDLISNVYYDTENGYGSIKNTSEQIKKVDPSIKYDDVKTWMNKQPNKQRKAYKGSNSYVAPFARFQYQIDIMDMINLKMTEEQPRYAIVVIDIFSKLGDAIPMINKDSVSVYNGLLIIF